MFYLTIGLLSIPFREEEEQAQIPPATEGNMDNVPTDIISIAYPDKFNLEFADLVGIVFDFSSGVGGYEYSIYCETITQEGVIGETKIGGDDLRYITSIPYGFDNANEFLLYLPGKSLHELPEPFLGWVYINIMTLGDSDVLEFYGLYSVEGEQGFSASFVKSNANT